MNKIKIKHYRRKTLKELFYHTKWSSIRSIELYLDKHKQFHYHIYRLMNKDVILYIELEDKTWYFFIEPHKNKYLILN